MTGIQMTANAAYRVVEYQVGWSGKVRPSQSGDIMDNILVEFFVFFSEKSKI